MEPKRKILIFSTAYLPLVGGAEIAIKEITDRISGDFEFDLITARFQKDLIPEEKIGNVTVYRLGTGNPKFDKLLLPIRGAIKASQLSNKNNYFCFWGVMVTFGSLAGFLCNMLRRIKGKKKIPMVLTLQEGDSEGHLKYKWGGLIALSWKLALRNTDVLTAISTFLLDRAKKNGYQGRSALVPNGVDIKIFSEKIGEDETNEMKKKLEKKEKDIFLVTVGRLTYKNGTDTVIESLQSLPKNINFIVIGKGIEGIKLQKLSEKLGVSERVKFIGFVEYKDIPKYFSVCDIFIRASRSEGFGNAFIEAMAAGIPVIATPVGGIPDFIDDKITGIFCAPDSPQSIKNVVMSLAQDKKLQEVLIENAKSRVLERYNWERISEEMKGAFEILN